jgi:hypothetical protein
MRLLVVPGAYFGLDPISAWGVRMLFGAEIPGPSRNGAFLEWTPTLYLSGDSSIFAAAMGSGSAAPGWFFLQGGVMNILSFRVGYRWYL